MSLIYACIAPHAGELIDDPDKIALTRQAMQEMGRTLQALAPEVVVIIDPHGFRVQNAISISVAERAAADWSPDLRLDFEMDRTLPGRIADRAAQWNVPVVRYIYGASGGPDCCIPLDWGGAVPLYFMGHRYAPRPKIVQISPMRLLPYRSHY
ncbi:MAG TPA: hypothetical protein VLZ89_09055, partial [Anaerolineales bacterium]|nr:hypothetical protein [Anaerolineales bacterium]